MDLTRYLALKSGTGVSGTSPNAKAAGSEPRTCLKTVRDLFLFSQRVGF